jgi:hypothetical protein
VFSDVAWMPTLDRATCASLLHPSVPPASNPASKNTPRIQERVRNREFRQTYQHAGTRAATEVSAARGGRINVPK